jgi:hypothetical protein
MILGFTGTQSFGVGEIAHLDACLEDLYVRLKPVAIVTGACIGVDAYVHHWFARNHPEVRRVVVVPANRSKVDATVLANADEVVEMAPHTDYRDRNVELVRRATTMAAFWTGKTAYSGTWMTMNIARRMGKIQPENLFGMAALSNTVARERYF